MKNNQWSGGNPGGIKNQTNSQTGGYIAGGTTISEGGATQYQSSVPFSGALLSPLYFFREQSLVSNEEVHSVLQGWEDFKCPLGQIPVANLTLDGCEAGNNENDCSKSYDGNMGTYWSFSGDNSKSWIRWSPKETSTITGFEMWTGDETQYDENNPVVMYIKAIREDETFEYIREFDVNGHHRYYPEGSFDNSENYFHLQPQSYHKFTFAYPMQGVAALEVDVYESNTGNHDAKFWEIKLLGFEEHSFSIGEYAHQNNSGNGRGGIVELTSGSSLFMKEVFQQQYNQGRECGLCPSGKYGRRMHFNLCEDCPEGMYSLPGSTQCSYSTETTSDPSLHTDDTRKGPGDIVGLHAWYTASQPNGGIYDNQWLDISGNEHHATFTDSGSTLEEVTALETMYEYVDSDEDATYGDGRAYIEGNRKSAVSFWSVPTDPLGDGHYTIFVRSRWADVENNGIIFGTQTTCSYPLITGHVTAGDTSSAYASYSGSRWTQFNFGKAEHSTNQEYFHVY
jgi:hypothetical protein